MYAPISTHLVSHLSPLFPASTLFRNLVSSMKYIIHLDLNRTILMSDAAGGRSMENTVNYLLSEVTWGTVKEEDGNKKWVCESAKPAIEAPSAGALTYKAFVDDELKYLKTGTDAAPAGYADVKSYNKATKKKRTALQSAFTSPDAPGSALAEECQNVIKSLSFPEEMQEQAKAASETVPDGALKDSWAAGRYFLLPSFLKLLRTVQEREQAETEIETWFVFRTFGVDILEVAKELDVLCAGTHPYCPGFVLDPRYRLTRPFNTFYRDGYGSEGLLLAEDTTEKVPAEYAKEQGGGLRYYKEQGIKTHEGFEAAAALIGSQLGPNRRVIGCRDYWEWWSAHAEEADYGKVLLVDQEDSSVHQAFFDDHVEGHHAHIVDTRDVKTGEVLPFERAKGRHLFRAEPYAAITNEDYFVDALDGVTKVGAS